MQQRILWVVTIAGAALAIWMFTIFFEEYEYEIDVGYSKEARINPFLAAQLFLEKNGVKVVKETSELDFSTLSTDDMVFLSHVDDMLLTNSQIEKALAWIEQGGFLVSGVGTEIQGHASILKRFDIAPVEHEIDLGQIADVFGDSGDKSTSERLRELNEKIAEQQKKNENDESADDNPIEDLFDLESERKRYTVALSDDAGELTLERVDRIVLNHPQAGDWYFKDDDDYDLGNSDDDSGERDLMAIDYELSASVSDEKGVRLLQFRHGSGTFTALSSSELWRNDEIGQADHAYFLAYLVPDQSTVHFFYNITSPSLWQMLKANFAELLLALAALLILWLWRAGLRVQSVREEVTTQRRLFAEHLRASAEFLVSRGQYRKLLQPVQEDIEAQMRPFHPGFSQLDTTTQVSLLAVRTEVPKETIQTWINYVEKVDNKDDLLAALKLGYAIRKKL